MLQDEKIESGGSQKKAGQCTIDSGDHTNRHMFFQHQPVVESTSDSHPIFAYITLIGMCV